MEKSQAFQSNETSLLNLFDILSHCRGHLKNFFFSFVPTPLLAVLGPSKGIQMENRR
jgi:hypothetical protein